MMPVRNKSANNSRDSSTGDIQAETPSSNRGTRNTQLETRSAHHAMHKLNREARTCWCINLDTIDYDEAWKLQTAIVEARINRVIDKDIVLMLEHPSVFTLGRRGGTENLLVSKSFLEKSGIAVTQVERGGNITYHGPGQLVVYPIVNLEAAKISVVEFVEALESVMIQTTAVWGIYAERNPVNRGIWVGNNKIGSVGIALRKGISFHGLALNINLDLTPFSWIQPCGLQGVRMTSIQQELLEKVPMADAQKVLTQKFESVFGNLLVDKSYSELKHILKHKIPNT